MSSRENRMNPVFIPYGFNGNKYSRLPYSTPANDVLQTDPAKQGATVSPDAYPDDLLRSSVTACLSVQDLESDERKVVEGAGFLILMAMDHRACRRHGYSHSKEERRYSYPTEYLARVTPWLVRVGSLLNDLALFHEDAVDSPEEKAGG